MIVDLGRPGGADDARLLGPRIGVSDIVGDRGVEQKRLLLNEPDMVAQGGETDGAHILAVDRHPAGGDVVEAGDQVRDRRFTGAGRPDDAERFSRPDFEADVGQDVVAGGVEGELDMLETQHAVCDLEIRRARSVGDLRLQVEDLEQASAGGGRPRGGGEDHGDLPDRRLQQGHVGQKFGEPARRHRPRRHLVPADPQQSAHRGIEGDRHHRDGAETQHDAPIGIGQRRAGGGVELAHLEALGGEGAHDAYALEVLLHGQGEDAHQALDLEPGHPQHEAHPRQDHAGDRRKGEADRGQDWVGGDHPPGGDAEQQTERQRGQHAVLDE